MICPGGAAVATSYNTTAVVPIKINRSLAEHVKKRVSRGPAEKNMGRAAYCIMALLANFVSITKSQCGLNGAWENHTVTAEGKSFGVRVYSNQECSRSDLPSVCGSGFTPFGQVQLTLGQYDAVKTVVR